MAAALLISCSLNIPQSLLTLRNQPVPSRWSKEPVIILSDTTRWSLSRAGDSNSLLEEKIIWYKINRRNPPALEKIFVQDDETTESPPEINLELFYPDGGKTIVDAKGFHRARTDVSGIYASNSFQNTFSVPGYQEGLLIRERVLRIRSRPQFDAYELIRSTYPCLHRTLLFREPAGYALNLGLRNGEGLDIRADTVVLSGAREIRYQADSLEKIQEEFDYKYPEDHLAAFWYCVPNRRTRSWSWQETGDYYLGLIGPSLETTIGMNPDSLGRRFASNEPTVFESFQWIQRHIRYLADEEKMNAFIPRPPDRISANGYGDCKEMSNLLRAICRKKGVEVGLALVRSGPGMQLREEFPALSTFNHMIAYRLNKNGNKIENENENGTIDYYDPTVNFGSPQASALHLEGQKILLLAPGKSRIDTVRAPKARGNRIVTQSVLTPLKGGAGFTPSGDGFSQSGKGITQSGNGFTLSGKIGLRGPVAFQLAAKLNYAKQNPEDARACMREFLRMSFGLDASTLSWQVEDADSLRIQYTHVPVLPIDNGGVTLALPSLYLGWDAEKSGYLPPADQRDEWTLPPGYGKLASSDARSAVGELHWKSGRGWVQRSYHQRGGIFKTARPGEGLPVQDSLYSRSMGWVGM